MWWRLKRSGRRPWETLRTELSIRAGLGLCHESHSCSVAVRMTGPLEQAVAAIVCTFQEYAGRCGDKYKLCQSELKELLQKELPTWTPVSIQTIVPPLDVER